MSAILPMDLRNTKAMARNTTWLPFENTEPPPATGEALRQFENCSAYSTKKKCRDTRKGCPAGGRPAWLVAVLLADVRLAGT